jgi:hypothetical protein
MARQLRVTAVQNLNVTTRPPPRRIRSRSRDRWKYLASAFSHSDLITRMFARRRRR